MLRALSDCRYVAFLMVPWLTLLVVAQCPPVGLPVTAVLCTGPEAYVILVQNTEPCAFTRFHVVFAVPVDNLTARALRPLPYRVQRATSQAYMLWVENTDPFWHKTFTLLFSASVRVWPPLLGSTPVQAVSGADSLWTVMLAGKGIWPGGFVPFGVAPADATSGSEALPEHAFGAAQAAVSSVTGADYVWTVDLEETGLESGEFLLLTVTGVSPEVPATCADLVRAVLPGVVCE